VDRALARMDAQLAELYSTTGRPSIARERLLRATLLMALDSIRPERQLMEQTNINLLFRWFVGLEMEDLSLGAPVENRNGLVVAAEAGLAATVTIAAYNLVRMRRLIPIQAMAA
jgi:transposase